MTTIDITSEILINKDIHTVFEYLSQYNNDPNWRDECNQSTINTGTLAMHSIITEDSFLSKRMAHYITEYQCILFEENKIIRCETTTKAPYWAMNTRSVTNTSNQQTIVTYQVSFDIAIVKHGLGFSLPKFLVNIYTQMVMKKYLKQLKYILEK